MDWLEEQRKEAEKEKAKNIFKVLLTIIICILLFPFMIVIAAANQIDK